MNEAHTLSWTDGSAVTSHIDEECQALLQRCLDGDEAAYVTLYDQYAGMVYRLAYGLLQHKEDAEEVLQDSFEYAFRKLAHFDPQKSAFTTWLYRITVSRCRNKRRRKWLPTFPLNLLPYQDVPDRHAHTPDDLMELDDQQKVIWRALTELSPKLRETAILRYYHGLCYKEIGDILSIPPKTAESRVRLAHKALREYLDDENLFVHRSHKVPFMAKVPDTDGAIEPVESGACIKR
jgi:RNA polymerase sigma-70 factor (ECF subfamily)